MRLCLLITGVCLANMVWLLAAGNIGKRGYVISGCLGTAQQLTGIEDISVKSDGQYSPWRLSQVLTINLGFGSLTYSTAKLIDVLWDVVVGRGG